MKFRLINPYYLFLAILLSCGAGSFAQITVLGRVVDGATDQPLRGASVYFHNTTLGTYTNDRGEFSFETIRLLNTELVISCKGYDLLAYRPEASKIENKRVVFKMKVADSANAKPGFTRLDRKACLDIFYKQYLGITHEAIKCTNLNGQTIKFYPANFGTGFLAYADTPLVFVNPELGYKISYNLVEFVYDDSSGHSYLNGFTRYEDMGREKRWLKNRRGCYLGSTLHFYRSLISNRLYDEGFGTFLIKPLYDSVSADTKNAVPVDTREGVSISVPIAAPQILFINDSNEMSIRVRGQLMVQYYKDTPAKIYLQSKDMVFGGLREGEQSFIYFGSGAMGLNSAGVLNDPASVEYSGFWTYEKAANFLPYDYQPE